MGNHGSKYFIAAVVFVSAFNIWKAPDGSPAAEHRAWLFNMLPEPIKDAYSALTLANMSWLAYVSYDWMKAAKFQLRIPVIAGHGLQFLGFFAATIYFWLLLPMPYIDTAVVWGSNIVHAAKTVLLEIIDALNQLHSRIEIRFSSALAYLIVGTWVFAELMLLLKTSAVVITALHSVSNILCAKGSRVDWRGVFLLSIASVFGYVGYLWMKVV